MIWNIIRSQVESRGFWRHSFLGKSLSSRNFTDFGDELSAGSLAGPDIHNRTIGRTKSLDRLLSVEERLSVYFKDYRATFPDSTLPKISFLLPNSKQESRSRVPRLYTVLCIIGQLHLLDEFIKCGITDAFFPFNAASLPVSLSPSIRASFLDHQPVVLTKALDLEIGE